MTDWEFGSRPGAEAEVKVETDSRARTRALFAVGAGVVAVNSALYFFGVESVSHPVVTVLGTVVLAALYLDRR